jgi:hypothetical protein
MARKTIEVGKLLKMTNAFLAAKHTTAEEREGVCALIEGVLFETGNYEGFRYLEGSDYPDEVVYAGSRRFYFASKAVREDYEAELRDINRIRV